jgi:hypothetical protein
VNVILSALKRWWFGTDPTLVELTWDHEMYQVVYQAWAGGFTVSSDVARRNAGHVAMASGLGLITTREPDESFGRTWYVTIEGIDYLNAYWENN